LQSVSMCCEYLLDLPFAGGGMAVIAEGSGHSDTRMTEAPFAPSRRRPRIRGRHDRAELSEDELKQSLPWLLLSEPEGTTVRPLQLRCLKRPPRVHDSGLGRIALT